MSKITRNTDKIKKELSKFLDFKINNIKIIGEGFRSIAIEVNDEFVFLIGKVPQASKTFSKEYKILPHIQNSTYKIPCPKWYIESTNELSYGFLGYTKIEGIILTQKLIEKTNLQNLAKDVASFLVELHSLDVNNLKLESPNFFDDDKKLYDSILPTLKQIFTKNEYALIVQWWEMYLNEKTNFNFSPKFVHGDVWPENFVIDKNLQHLIGIIDFEACGLGNPACDFAPLNYIGSDFLENVLLSYTEKVGIDDLTLRQRIDRQWEKREFGGLLYAIENNDEEELHDSIMKIRKGPILSL